MISLNSVRPFCWFHTYYLITTRFRINNAKISRVIILLSNRTLSALKCPVYKGFQKIFCPLSLLIILFFAISVIHLSCPSTLHLCPEKHEKKSFETTMWFQNSFFYRLFLFTKNGIIVSGD